VPLLLRGKEEAPFYTIKELRLMWISAPFHHFVLITLKLGNN
jgi:hypothetical protein